MIDARRAAKKFKTDPANVKSLAPDHPAIVGNRTIFPHTVKPITADSPARLLISGFNNKKIGREVKKGKFKGYHLYNFSLEERATCPQHCGARAFCYGNGMHWARRHQVGDFRVFADRMREEIKQLLKIYPGLLIRLHVLGDFYSVEYVRFWGGIVADFENVVIWGYTHCDFAEDESAEIARAIAGLKAYCPDRFRIRWSGSSSFDGTVILDDVPEGKQAGDSIVCPAQTQASECCATCGLCWETRHNIAFIKHGPKKAKGAA